MGGGSAALFEGLIARETVLSSSLALFAVSGFTTL